MSNYEVRPMYGFILGQWIARSKCSTLASRQVFVCGFLSQHLAFLLAFLIIHTCTTRHNSFLLVECTQGGGGFLYHQPLAGCRFCWCKTSCIVFAETAKKGIWNLVYSMHLRWVQYSIAECVGSSVRVVSFLRTVF